MVPKHIRETFSPVCPSRTCSIFTLSRNDARFLEAPCGKAKRPGLGNLWNFWAGRGILPRFLQDLMTSIEAVSDEPEAWFKLDRDGRKLALGGSWTIGESARLDRELKAIQPAGSVLEIDASQVSRMDSAG